MTRTPAYGGPPCKESATSVEAVIEMAYELEDRLEEKAWRRRRRAKMTAHEPPPIETC